MRKLLGQRSFLPFLALLLVFIPLGTRKLIHQFISGFHEYETIFFYASDIFLILFLIFGFKYLKSFFLGRWPKTLIILLGIFEVFAFVSIFLAYSRMLAVYNFVRLELLILFAIVLYQMVREKVLNLKIVFGIIAALAVIQSLIVFGQFSLQRDLELQVLGESVLGQDVLGVAKIPIFGTDIIRGYGTFPHPNVLSAFLIFGLFALYFWYLKFDWQRQGFVYNRAKSVGENFKVYRGTSKLSSRVLVTLGIGIVLLGLLFTFSRTAWGIAPILSLIFIAFLLFNKDYRGPAVRLLSALIAMSILIFSFFHWAIFPRATISVSEPAVTERVSFGSVGVNLIQNNFFGVGIGNQVLHSVKNDIYQDFAGLTEVYEWQPIHNIYILVGSEIGVIGALAFVIFLIFLLIKALKTQSVEACTVSFVLLSLFLFGFFDHFLWTLEPGRLMLWLIIGLALGLGSPRSSADRT